MALVGDLERDTELSGKDGHYTAELSRDWEIWGPNGGYLSAIALRAAGAVAKIRRPASFAGQFLRVAEFGKVDVRVSVPRAGRRSAARPRATSSSSTTRTSARSPRV